jgi:DNA-directed RNA polymerase subunit RPC12/RpoP
MHDADPHKNVEINDARQKFLEAARPDVELDGVHPDAEDLVDLEDACRRCGERRVQQLVWQADLESIRCGDCGATYVFKE